MEMPLWRNVHALDAACDECDEGDVSEPAAWMRDYLSSLDTPAEKPASPPTAKTGRPAAA